MENNNDNSLIIVKQLPIIEQQLQLIKEELTERTNIALSLVCTDETIQTIKKERASLTKTFEMLETKRKEAKKAILKPYDEFEKIYKSCVTDIYNDCDRQLAKKIKEVEDSRKAQKYIAVEEYFNEYAESKNIDFLTFKQIGLNITLSASEKSLKEQAKAYVDRVEKDLQTIETQENSTEILVEYKISLDLAKAITTVANRHKAIEQEQQKQAEIAEIEERQAENVEKVDEVIEMLAPPEIEQEETEIEQETEQLYEVTFTVSGTLEQIKKLKAFLQENNYNFE